MDNVIRLSDDADPAVGAALRRAYAIALPADTAARHLQSIRAAAAARQRQRGLAGSLQRAAMLAGVCALVLATAGGAVAASQQSRPGEALYGVKLGAERAHLLLETDAEAEALLHLRFARRRLWEAHLAGDSPDVVPHLLRRAAAAVEEAERLAPAALVSETTAVREEIDETAAGLKSGSGDVAADGGDGADDSAAEPFELGPAETSTAETTTALVDLP